MHPLNQSITDKTVEMSAMAEFRRERGRELGIYALPKELVVDQKCADLSVEDIKGKHLVGF